MVIFPLAPDQTIAQMWSNGARGVISPCTGITRHHLPVFFLVKCADTLCLSKLKTTVSVTEIFKNLRFWFHLLKPVQQHSLFVNWSHYWQTTLDYSLRTQQHFRHSLIGRVTHFVSCDWSKLKVDGRRFVAGRRYGAWRRRFRQLKSSCPRLQQPPAAH